MATDESSSSGPSLQDADMQTINSLTSDLVSKGQMAPEHQAKIVQSATAATAKIDELREFLSQHFTHGLSLLGPPPSQQPARQQVIDSISGTVLHVNRIQSTFSDLSDAGQEVAQKVISIILSRLMAVLDDFKKHMQYQNWAVTFIGGVPFTLQVGIQITFQ